MEQEQAPLLEAPMAPQRAAVPGDGCWLRSLADALAEHWKLMVRRAFPWQAAPWV